MILDSLERRWGRWCIPGLLRIVGLLQALTFILIKANPVFLDHFQLNPSAVLSGEIWRVLSFVFLPSTLSFIWIIFAVWFLFFIGDILESQWGSFRLNVYYFSCVILLNVAAFATGYATRMEATFLYISLFLAACVIAPEVEIMFMLIFPVKLKYLGLVNGALLALMLFSSPASWAAVFAVLLPFAVFVGPSWFGHVRHQVDVHGRRRRFQVNQRSDDEAFHTCKTCGVTELQDPHAEFRIAADGDEYCLKCLPGKTEA
ncbi:MAG: hypothetical protein ACKV19_04455 [Verrucomicrobiales bacterium]